MVPGTTNLAIWKLQDDFLPLEIDEVPKAQALSLTSLREPAAGPANKDINPDVASQQDHILLERTAEYNRRLQDVGSTIGSNKRCLDANIQT